MIHKIEGKSLPEAFFRKVKKDPKHIMFASKWQGSWREMAAGTALDYCLQTVAGLKALGFSENDKICIFSENREEWILTDYAAQWLGGCTTAIYTTSALSDIEVILNESEAKVLFVSNRSMFQRLGDLSRYEKLETIVFFDEKPRDLASGRIKMLDRSEFLKPAISEDEATELFEKIDEENIAILLYTSGTTGKPKGVVLTQRNIVSNIRQLHDSIPLEGLEVTVSFLPLSHIYERALHSTLLIAGIRIGFAEGIDQLIDNIAEIQPKIMIGVPRIFEKMYIKIQEKLKNAPVHKKLLANWAFSVGLKTVPYRLKNQKIPLYLRLPYAVADALVLKKIREITGGRLEYFVSGGAPLSIEIAEFFFQAGITILEGYGLSETIILAFNRPGRIRFGTVGEPLDETEIRIADDGEILVRGPQIMKGYYQAPEESSRVLLADGWFRTGDIGEFRDGYLRITDRKKEIIITAGGKNVAPQPIENALKADPLVEQVCVVGDRRKYLSLLIVPNLEMCASWGERKGLKLKSLADCAESEALKERVQKLIDDVNESLPSYSTIKYFTLLQEPFTVNGGELTPTLKMKRRVIQERYDAEIDRMYPQEERDY